MATFRMNDSLRTKKSKTNAMKTEDDNTYLRTLQQNRALHKFCTEVANTLNEAGLDIRTTLKPDFEIDWSPLLVKELLWKQTQKIVLGKESTTQMTTKEVNEIYEVINRFLAKHGVHIAFPSIIGESLESIK